MRVQIRFRVITDDGTIISDDEIACFDKGTDHLEDIGLSLSEAKALLASTQAHLTAAQAACYVARHRHCPTCGLRLRSKGRCRILFRTAFGTVPLASPRLHRCGCQPAASKTFSPLTGLLTEHTAPELLFLETRWASLLSYGMTVDLLRDVLPIGATANAATVRNDLHRVAARCEAEPGAGQPDLSAGARASTGL